MGDSLIRQLSDSSGVASFGYVSGKEILLTSQMQRVRVTSGDMERTDSTDRAENREFRQHDRQLALRMALAQAGDVEAYRQLLEEVRVMLVRYCTNALRRFGLAEVIQAEDVVQDAMLALHRKRQTYDPSQPFGAWLYAIARYKVIDYARRRRVEISLEDWDESGRAESESATTIQSTADGWGAEELEKLLAQLTPSQRDLLRDIKIEGLSVREASRRSGLSESAVKVTVHRALKALRQFVDGGNQP